MKSASQLRIVLTGATEGIGRAMALQLADQGAHLVLAARNQSRLDEIAHECRERGATAHAVVTDVGEEQQCQHLIDESVNHLGGIDVLINNAGITMWTLFQDISDLGIFERVMRINYLSAVWLSHMALPHLLKTEGRIVGVASLAGLTGVPTRTGYAASKHAMFGFFDSLRIELRNTGVSVTMTAPDFVRSQIHKRALTADGGELGKSPLEQESIMSSEECAAQIISAMLARKRLQIMTMRGHFLRFAKLLFPGLIDRMASKAIRKGK